MMPLSFAPFGKELVVKKINLDENLTKRLGTLGLLVGSKLISLSSDGGSLILKIKESRLVLNKGIAMKILVD